MLRIACVLKSGGEYTPEHVHRLRDAVARHLPGARFVCLSDVPVNCERIILQHDWPGWWAKMEMFRPHVVGDVLYMDLDTMIVGDLSEIASVNGLTVLSDFYWPQRIQSSLMFIPEAERAPIWKAFTADPARHMRECTTRERWGDQGFLNGFWSGRAARWQGVLPGHVSSWKVHCRQGVPPDTRIIVFHGKPRPWEVGWLWGRAA
jgi:hypothetical protein